MAKIRDLKEQNKNYKIDVIDVLASMDPSKTNKYFNEYFSKTSN